MPEIDQTPIAEATPSKERLAYNSDFVGLRVRLLMGQDMLNSSKPVPQSPEEIKKAFEQLELRANTTYRLLTNLSTDERIKYWQTRAKEEQNLSQAEAQKTTWKKEVVSIFNDPDSGDYKAVFGKFQIGDINWKKFNDSEAEKVYQRYFQDSRMTPITLDGKTTCLPSSIIQYVEDVLNQYIRKQPIEGGKTQLTVDFDQLQKDLSTIQAFSTIFGKQYSYEILAQLIDAEIKNAVTEKQQEEINTVLQKEKVGEVEKTRGDNLRDREIELLEALQKASAYKEVEGPIPSPKPPAPPQPGEGEEELPEPRIWPEPEKSQPLPTGYQWVYEKAKPEPEKPSEVRTFPESHLIENMINPRQIAHDLKRRSVQRNDHKYDFISEENLAKEIAKENLLLQSHLSKLGLDNQRLIEVLNQAMSGYRSFIENNYHVKLPNIGSITIVPIWGKAAELYNPKRTALAFVVPTIPAIFMDIGVIQAHAKRLYDEDWTDWEQLTPEKLGKLMVRVFNEIRPHETSHLSSDLAFWFAEEQPSKKKEKVAIGKLGPLVAKPLGLDTVGEIMIKERGRGLMEAVTVEMTRQWGHSFSPPQELDIDAYKAERSVLNDLIKQMMEEQNLSYDQAFAKFVEAYFTRDGFRHLASELSGQTYGTEWFTPKEPEKWSKFRKVEGKPKRPHYLSIIYALMEYEAHRAVTTGSLTYSLTRSYIHNSLTENQKQEILGIAKSMEEAENKKVLTYLTLPKAIREYLKNQDTRIVVETPIPPKPKPPEPPKQEPDRKPIRVTPEQNLRATQIFCVNLRSRLKNGKMEKWNDAFRFTDKQTGIYVDAADKNSVDTTWFSSGSLESYGERHHLPFILLVEGGNHFNLLLKGPTKQPDGIFRIAVYDPFNNAEEYREVPISEEFAYFRERKLKEMEKLLNPTTKRYEFQDGSWVEQDNINYFLFSQWFKPPVNFNLSYNNHLAWNYLLSGEYDLTLLEDAELPGELIAGKTQQFQFNGYDCGPISLYSAVLRYAAKPGKEREKQSLVEQFAKDYGVRILTRKELLGK